MVRPTLYTTTSSAVVVNAAFKIETESKSDLDLEFALFLLGDDDGRESSDK
jgi:hypothetical protein